MSTNFAKIQGLCAKSGISDTKIRKKKKVVIKCRLRLKNVALNLMTSVRLPKQYNEDDIQLWFWFMDTS